MNDALTVVTTFGEPQWEAYASRSMSTWSTNLPPDTRFHFHTDSGFQPVEHDTVTYFQDTQAKKDFIARNDAIGRRAPDHFHPVGKRWNGYHHKVFAQYESWRRCDTRWMIFLDADVAMLKPFDQTVLAQWLDRKFCGYIGRDPLLTETGFLAYDLACPDSNRFFESFVAMTFCLSFPAGTIVEHLIMCARPADSHLRICRADSPSLWILSPWAR